MDEDLEQILEELKQEYKKMLEELLITEEKKCL